MKFEECRRYVNSDLKRLTLGNKSGGVKLLLRYLTTNASFKVTFWFRIASFLCLKRGFGWKILHGVVALIRRHYAYKTGIQMGVGTNIGGGLLFSHYSCIVINGGATIGKNCTIFQGVTVGSVRGVKGGVPSIGDNVVLAAGTKVIGNVHIGNNVMIGAGSVVVTDIPDNAVAVGNPARVINYRGKENVELYI